jgi:hypothetical protein
MLRRLFDQPLVFGVLGAILGILAEGAANRALGAQVVSDGPLWGALFAVALASVPNFRRMGSRLLANGSRWQQVLVGVAAFAVISVVIVAAFLGISSLVLHYIP